MSEQGEIDKCDLAQMVLTARENESTAHSVAMQNIAYALWDSYGTVETTPDVSEQEAERILAELPVDYDEMSGL
jgi:hypothetical protein